MKTAIVYHRVDWDGFTSAAVCLKAFPNAELFGWTYNDPEPDMSSFDKIILVDLSLSEDWMLQNADKLIWIDHHKNAIDKLQSNPELASIPGERKDGIGACRLCWKRFIQPTYLWHVEGNFHIDHVATADVMDTTNKLGVSIQRALNYMLFLDELGSGVVDGKDVSKPLVYKALHLIEHSDDAINGICRGTDLEHNRNNHEWALFRKKSRSGVIKQNNRLYSFCVIEVDSRPNACIQSHLLKGTHHFFVCVSDKKVDDKFKVSVRVPLNSDFDASEFCRQYGGNGHIKAAGCLMTEEQLKALF